MRVPFLCRLNVHIEYFEGGDVAAGSSCPCGKKRSPPIRWPTIPTQRRLADLSEGVYQRVCCGNVIGSKYSFCPSCGRFLW